MTIIKIEKNANGSHDNQTIDGVTPETFPVPKGWAEVPDGLETPNFPFGEAVVEAGAHCPAVTAWTPLPIPAPEPVPDPEPTQLDRVEAQAAYTAMMTDTLLEV